MSNNQRRNLFEDLLREHDEEQEEITRMQQVDSDSDSDDDEIFPDWSKQIDELIDRASQAGKTEEEAFGVYVHFSTQEFLELFGFVQDVLTPSGRGKKPKFGPRDYFRVKSDHSKEEVS